MFDQYTQINKILPEVPAIKQIHRASGIGEMEETLQEKLRSLQFPLLVVEDDGNGYLNLRDQNFDNQLFTFYIFGQPKQGSSTSRKETLMLCRKAALLLFNRMKQGSRNFIDPFYGLDFSRIDYQQLGPIANGLHGYSFTYLFRDENFRLVEPDPAP